MQIEVCVIENNPESLNGPAAAIWTEVFTNPIDADAYVETIHNQENAFISKTGIPVTYTIMGMFYLNPNSNVQPLSIVEVQP